MFKKKLMVFLNNIIWYGEIKRNTPTDMYKLIIILK